MEVSKHIVDLVTNSFEALAKHILVMLTEEADGSVTLCVSDDGVGIKEEDVVKALAGEKTPRGNGLRLLKEAADDLQYGSDERGTHVCAAFRSMQIGNVGDALIVFWQEMRITAITLSAVSPRGEFCFDSRLIGEKYGDPADIQTMVKVRKDVNYALTNLFGGKKE
ncbi:MAG: sensor histidine kinase [Clostridia bacterium]|nr:sensor histidine kinase [Clostridia bacterium]